MICAVMQLRNGDSVDSPVVGDGRLCGNSIPSVMTTSGNHLHVKFVSNEARTDHVIIRSFIQSILSISSLVVSPH